MTKTFYELVRIAIGRADSFSHTPSQKEWKELFEMAKKQSLVGVCFAGVQRLAEDERPQGMLYLTWMGLAAKIQQRNEVMNQRCVELQERLAKDGFKSCILKGQGVAALYGELGKYRQSGDIDVWVDMPKEKVVEWAKTHGETEAAGYLHTACRLFEDTEVELHYRPTYSRCPWHNINLQQFCKVHKHDWCVQEGLVVPSREFNIVYLLSHLFRHLIGSGIGMRQLMDYYYVLRDIEFDETTKQRVNNHFVAFGLKRFAQGIMYIMEYAFGLPKKHLLCDPDPEVGHFILNSISESGNFGHNDEKQKKARASTWGFLKWKLNKSIRMLQYFPWEVLCEPVWKIRRKWSDK